MFRITCAKCEQVIEAPSYSELPEQCPHCGKNPSMFGGGCPIHGLDHLDLTEDNRTYVCVECDWTEPNIDYAYFTQDQLDYLRKMGVKIEEA